MSGGVGSIHPPETNLGRITSWLPVTTTFSAPVGCSSQIWSSAADSKSPFVGSAFDPLIFQSYDRSWSCQPDVIASWWQQFTRDTFSQTVTSLAPVACPNLYTTAGSTIIDASSTLYACCPSGYSHSAIWNTFSEAALLQCMSNIAAGATISYWAHEATTGTLKTTVVGVGAFMKAVPINGYKFGPESGATKTSASSSTSSLVPASVATLSSIVTPSSSPAVLSTASPSSSGLSTGAKAGIAIGVVTGVAGLLALIVAIFLIRRNRGKAKTSDFEPVASSSSPEDKKDNSCLDRSSSGTRHELDPGIPKPHEMGMGRRDEMPELDGSRLR